MENTTVRIGAKGGSVGDDEKNIKDTHKKVGNIHWLSFALLLFTGGVSK